MFTQKHLRTKASHVKEISVTLKHLTDSYQRLNRFVDSIPLRYHSQPTSGPGSSRFHNGRYVCWWSSLDSSRDKSPESGWRLILWKHRTESEARENHEASCKSQGGHTEGSNSYQEAELTTNLNILYLSCVEAKKEHLIPVRSISCLRPMAESSNHWRSTRMEVTIGQNHQSTEHLLIRLDCRLTDIIELLANIPSPGKMWHIRLGTPPQNRLISNIYRITFKCSLKQ